MEVLRSVVEAWGARELVPGGHGPPRVIDGGGERFLANRQGGFAVRCPVGGANLVPLFVRALEGWRAGGVRSLECPCGARHDLAALDYLPEAGFARAWIEIPRAEAPELHPRAQAEAVAALGGVRVVPRRG